MYGGGTGPNRDHLERGNTVSVFTYREISDALAAEGIACRQENTGGGIGALVVSDSRGGSIIIGNGEWVVGDPMTDSVHGGLVSVTTESASGIYSGDSDEYVLCNSGYGVVAVVVALMNDGMIECSTVECVDSEHHVFELSEDTRRGYDPCPVFTCPNWR